MNLLRLAEVKVILFVVLSLAGLEVGARLFEVRLSKDVRHIRSLPEAAASLKAAPAERLKVLILGNSLSRDGLDKEILKTGLTRLTGREVELVAMYPDGTSINQWYYGYRRYFDQTGALPDLVLLGSARLHVLDNRFEPDRLAAFYTSVADMPQLLGQQEGDVEAISKVLLARVSMSFAHRTRVQPLVFYNLIPGYTETSQTIGVVREEMAPAVPKADMPPETCEMLTELLKTLNEGHVHALLLAIPMTKPYTMPDCALASAAAAQVPVIVAGESLYQRADYFYDGYHLGPEGSAEYTRLLIEKISQTPGALPPFSR
ncbi:hypothetical protein [Prosthecobacter dejongeii]|uniref:SGNH/GDSL hydrolase family protein n=1 Tax=Prosthecobacter dejongeii TaxID=48465 RepID=A0A7W8DRU8_9BACT|nr:hypothetical protein [Prosthecobacter dejongeii]MBB5039873.1 hypothetical protein [Prosthecobacter dejongeii]